MQVLNRIGMKTRGCYTGNYILLLQTDSDKCMELIHLKYDLKIVSLMRIYFDL